MPRRSRRRRVAQLALLAAGLTVAALAAVLVLQARDAARIEQAWRETRVQKVAGLGATRALEIVPLVNWSAARPGLLAEPGVAYLIRTDHGTLLFDLGFNREEAAVPPLLHNMRVLGLPLDEVDAVFISHAHRDHVGGTAAESARTLAFGDVPVDLAGRPVFSPVPLNHPGTVVTAEPARLLEGVATTGAIARRLVMGRVEEQALVVHVEGRGLVVIVGCGHQTVPKLLKRLEEAFDEPLHGIVGDLHYPVPTGRLVIAGIDAQRRFASGGGLLAPLTGDQVAAELDLLAAKVPGLLALGGHDTSDAVLEQAARRLGDRFRRVEVGTPIRVEAP